MYGISRLRNSVEAEHGAENLINKIELEEKDYISYRDFLKSVNGKRVLEMLEEEDAGEFVEL